MKKIKIFKKISKIMKTKEKKFVAIEKNTWESFFWDNVENLMKKLNKEHKWLKFFIKSLDPNYKFLMKLWK